MFRSVCAAHVADDGLVFLAETLAVQPIREDQEYGGLRVTLLVRLGTAKIDLQIDVRFGDAITPKAESVTFPTILGMDPPELRAYPRETVDAEKLEAMVKLGMTNSRMKDFFDLSVMARRFPFSGSVVRDAIAATFGRRKTALPTSPPVALSEVFAEDETKQKQWAAFRTRSGLHSKSGGLADLLAELFPFLTPPLVAAAMGEEFLFDWKPGGPWMTRQVPPTKSSF